MVDYDKEIVNLLKKKGFSPTKKGKGSHVIWEKGARRVCVSHSIKSRHTANAILKQAGINKKF